MAVILVERSPFVAYVADDLPYEMAEPFRSLESVVFATGDEFRGEDGIELRVEHEVLKLHPKERTLLVRDHKKSREYTLDYGSVVLATGAKLETGQLEGLDTRGVFAPRQLHDATALRRYFDERSPRSALVVGGGKTGLALAESLRRLGLDVLLAEKSAQLLPELGVATGRALQREADLQGVSVKLSQEVCRFERDGDRVAAHTKGKERFTADVVVIATGLVPETSLATEAGIVLGASGAIQVDHQMHTSAPRVFAAGECAEAFDRVSRRHRFHPSPATSFKQGDVAGSNAAGAHRAFHGMVGTSAVRFFEIEAARTGLSRQALLDFADRAIQSESTQASRGHAGGEPADITTLLHVERGTGRLLAAEMVGRGTVAKRIDVFATALHADMRVDEIASLDLAWSPAFSPVLDPILVGARAAREKSGVVLDRGDQAFTPDV